MWTLHNLHHSDFYCLGSVADASSVSEDSAVGCGEGSTAEPDAIRATGPLL